VRWIGTVPVALLLLTACASGTRSRRVTGDEVSVEVQNDLLPRTAVTVRVISSSGARRLIGAVSPGQTRMFRFEQQVFLGSYRLVAESNEGVQVVSIPMVLSSGLRVIWVLRNNILRVASRTSGDRSNGYPVA
jgi:outer membrane biogenesis lipoprotein LolB